MARHRNIRQLGLDDISTYDETLASSVDDDYAISPNTAELYLYDASKRKARSLAFFAPSAESLHFSSEDFPANTQGPEVCSPGDVTGRIRSNGVLRVNEEKADNSASADLELSEPHFDDPVDFMTPAGRFDKRHHYDDFNANTFGDLEEMEFDDFERLTSTSHSNFNRPPESVTHPTAHLPLPTPARLIPGMFSKASMDFLKQGSSLYGPLESTTVAGKRKHTVTPVLISSRDVQGYKSPSSLGVTMSSKDSSSTFWGSLVDMVMWRALPVFVRSRSLSVYPHWIVPGHRKAFQFSTPEPNTFATCNTTGTPQRLKSALPAPRKRKPPIATQEATKVGNKPILSETREPTEVGKLSQALSQKLDVTSQPKERSMSSRGSFVALSTPGTPSKPIDRTPLLTEYLDRRKNTTEKEVVNLIVVGHVDAGKSTLMGNMLCQLGNVSGKQLSKYRWEAQKLGKASFAYAWVLDQTAEERTRGVTMDIAQTSFETATKRIALMDAPGHKDFVPRVIGGASQADAALLVVNATNGEFETGFGVGGQTREHARLARLLGVSRLIVAVNKMDTVGWKQERYDAIKTQMNGFLKGLNLPGTIFCPVSGLTGVNLLPAGSAVLGKDSDQDGEERLRSWYDGPSLIDIIDSLPSPDRTINGPFRFVVSDIFKPAGLGVPAVAGRVISGGVSAGVGLNTSKVFCQPSALSATVKSIRSLCNVRSGSEPVESDSSANLLDQIVKCAFAGDQVALILQGIDPSQSLVPGDVITDPDNPVPLASRIQAKILVFTVPQPITRGYPVIFYYHCTSVSANISKLKSMTHRENKMEKTVKKPRCLLGNCTADVEITLDRPVCLEVYERCKSLGRFMLRVGGESIAGGTVTAVLPPKRNRLIDT
ncbi:hypothetical protein CRM22_003130 [Opisthorchis felineus]|uniref:Tr-type G domain-containing protein n=1 Tax=Opisthorchis felineus TaxID=147828 RepID=A0A4S2M7H9_OPIFE|nr:hypothetical protein CRM22_003130 [Opisthorchis felineus]